MFSNLYLGTMSNCYGVNVGLAEIYPLVRVMYDAIETTLSTFFQLSKRRPFYAVWNRVQLFLNRSKLIESGSKPV